MRLARVLLSLLLAVIVYLYAPGDWLFSAAKGGWEYPFYLFLCAVAVALAGEAAWAARLPADRADAGSPPPGQDWTV
ncbi:MAG: hypothetical protein V4757_17015 [Pseudomonadota bacterium]